MANFRSINPTFHGENRRKDRTLARLYINILLYRNFLERWWKAWHLFLSTPSWMLYTAPDNQDRLRCMLSRISSDVKHPLHASCPENALRQHTVKIISTNSWSAISLSYRELYFSLATDNAKWLSKFFFGRRNGNAKWQKKRKCNWTSRFGYPLEF